jgi:hypothetical protein
MSTMFVVMFLAKNLVTCSASTILSQRLACGTSTRCTELRPEISAVFLTILVGNTGRLLYNRGATAVDTVLVEMLLAKNEGTCLATTISSQNIALRTSGRTKFRPEVAAVLLPSLGEKRRVCG